jgi:hypothetical protein
LNCPIFIRRLGKRGLWPFTAAIALTSQTSIHLPHLTIHHLLLCDFPYRFGEMLPGFRPRQRYQYIREYHPVLFMGIVFYPLIHPVAFHPGHKG